MIDTTILDHITAGHYPTDSKGRALVPMKGGGTATILATDAPGLCPIVGWMVTPRGKVGAWQWQACGRAHEMYEVDALLPPETT